MLVHDFYEENIYKFYNVCPFDYIAFMVSRKIEITVNWFNHTSRIAAVTLTDHPKLVRNCFIIEQLILTFLCYHFAFLLV